MGVSEEPRRKQSQTSQRSGFPMVLGSALQKYKKSQIKNPPDRRTEAERGLQRGGSGAGPGWAKWPQHLFLFIFIYFFIFVDVFVSQ